MHGLYWQPGSKSIGPEFRNGSNSEIESRSGQVRFTSDCCQALAAGTCRWLSVIWISVIWISVIWISVIWITLIQITLTPPNGIRPAKHPSQFAEAV
jgi:hypothetical protein